ncbi:metal ABC transporter substrate-binding protein [Actinomyces sp. B33]|uniref:metal ABC transporter substrate-binding protein n=1 Tax=Actinomyces sp. B33 TaxID=2942131 RepID=UPI00233F93B9|nr:metal ABC transporter substrate-binding protein [Actinomyces sp. B33]MDC4233709.1 metal ABC transporter substrate-binding protein [Actinomyces sp. B33]
MRVVRPSARPSRFLVSATAALAGAAVLSACGPAGTDTAASSQPNEAAAPAGDSVKVVATTTQICDYVTQIATDSSAEATLALVKTAADGTSSTAGAPADSAQSTIELTCLLAPNASAHEHEMTPQQTKALSQADIMLVNGVDLEHFLDDAIESSGFHGIMGVTTGVLSSADIDDLDKVLASEKNLSYTVDRGAAKVEVAEWPFPPEDGEEAEFRFDPHVWTSPKNAAIQVANIGDVLAKASPDNAQLFNSHVEKYQQQLADLDQWAQESLSSIPDEHRVLFTSHDAFGYFSKSYGIEFIGAALSDFSEQQDATAAHIAEAAEQVKASGATALFAENSNNSKSIEAIAKAAGVTAVIGDDALYGDSLGPDGTEGETYVGSIIHNVTTLVTAWQGQLAPLPSSLN